MKLHDWSDVTPIQALTPPAHFSADDLAPRRFPGQSVAEQLKHMLRARHNSRRTEKAYLGWVRRYSTFFKGRDPRELGSPEVRQYLSYLAVRSKVSASTQNQAF